MADWHWWSSSTLSENAIHNRPCHYHCVQAAGCTSMTDAASEPSIRLLHNAACMSKLSCRQSLSFCRSDTGQASRSDTVQASLLQNTTDWLPRPVAKQGFSSKAASRLTFQSRLSQDLLSRPSTAKSRLYASKVIWRRFGVLSGHEYGCVVADQTVARQPSVVKMQLRDDSSSFGTSQCTGLLSCY